MSIEVSYEDVSDAWKAAVEEAQKQRREDLLNSILSSLVERPNRRHFLFEEETTDMKAGTWGVLVKEYNVTVLIYATHDTWDESKYVQIQPNREEVCDFTLNEKPDNIYTEE